MRLARFLCIVAVAIPTIGYAAEPLLITPETAATTDQAFRALQGDGQSAKEVIEGDGDRLRMIYSSPAPLHVSLAPLRSNGTFNPTQLFSFVLPATEKQEAIIDLAAHPSWRPGHQQYYFGVVVMGEGVPVVESFEFIPTSFLRTVRAAILHLFTIEPYRVSTYHTLIGYHVLGMSLAVFFGILLVLIVLFLIIRKRTVAAFAVLAAFILLYDARASMDLLRFSQNHLAGSASATSFAEAGSTYQAADVIVSLSQSLPSTAPTGVYVCTDATDFNEKLLRYFLYPNPVTHDPKKPASFAIVMRKAEWGFDGTTLSCGDLQVRARLLSSFDDGSELFRITP
jgi:hypothetical protein